MLSSARTHRKIAYPNGWQCISRHELVQKKLVDILRQHTQTMYGDYLLRLGPMSNHLAWQGQGIRREIALLNHPLDDVASNCISDYCHLALQAHAMDAILACHVLDFSADPHLQLREFDRVLRSDGYLLLTGINPFSMTGMARYSPWYRSHPLKQARCFSLPRVVDWLGLLSFEVLHSEYLAGHNLFAKSQKTTDSRLLNSMSVLSSMYVIIARKREAPLNLIASKFAKLKPRLQPAVSLSSASRE